MKKIVFTHTDQVCDFFRLMEITDEALLKNLELLLKIAAEKDAAVDVKNFDAAAAFRAKEVAQIKTILGALNKKKILKENVLTIEIVPHTP